MFRAQIVHNVLFHLLPKTVVDYPMAHSDMTRTAVRTTVTFILHFDPFFLVFTQKDSKNDNNLFQPKITNLHATTEHCRFYAKHENAENLLRYELTWDTQDRCKVVKRTNLKEGHAQHFIHYNSVDLGDETAICSFPSSS